MPTNERTPLMNELENGEPESPQPFSRRVLRALQGHESGPGWLQSFNFFFFKSFFNIFLVFIPLGAVAHFANWDAGLRFAFNFLAIIPLARVRLLI
jgi:Ca2+:H+ antiporter